MLAVAVNTAAYLEPETLLDAVGEPVTDKVNADWTKTALLLGTATTATPTITHLQNGIHTVVVTFTATGLWYVPYSVVVNGVTRRFAQTVDVKTAGQLDPSAAIAALSGDIADFITAATSLEAVLSGAPDTSVIVSDLAAVQTAVDGLEADLAAVTAMSSDITTITTKVNSYLDVAVSSRAASANLVDVTDVLAALDGIETATTELATELDAFADVPASLATNSNTLDAVNTALDSRLSETRLARLDLIGTGRQVVVTSPVSADAETLTLVQGDDYSVATSNPIEFTEPSDGPSWPTLTGATPRLVITNRVNASVIDDTGTVEVATGSSKRVQFELTAEQTGALRVGNPAYTFAVIVTLAGGAGDRTLIRGDVVVERDSRP